MGSDARLRRRDPRILALVANCWGVRDIPLIVPRYLRIAFRQTAAFYRTCQCGRVRQAIGKTHPRPRAGQC